MSAAGVHNEVRRYIGAAVINFFDGVERARWAGRFIVERMHREYRQVGIGDVAAVAHLARAHYRYDAREPSRV